MSTMMRKRRSNSDSEITLLDSLTRQLERKSLNYDCDLSLMSQHNITDGINIDLLNDSVEHHLFNGDSTMDPSQMFVVSSNYSENIFSCSSPLNTLENSPKIESPIVEQLPTLTTLNLPPPDQNPLLPTTQLLFFDTGLSNSASTMFITGSTPSNLMLESPKETPKTKPAKKKKPCPVAPQNKLCPVTSQGKLKIEKDEEIIKINKQWINDPVDLKNKDCRWKSGLWSVDEENLLRSNIDNYCKKMNMADPIKMIYFTPKEDRKEFYRSVSTGINRPLFTIYRKVLRMYDSKNYVGKYSADEVDKLEKLNQICPNDWKSIGLMLGRSASSVKDRARLIKPQTKCGRWNETELNALSKAIREETKTKVGESVTDGINWVKVAQRISTRTAKQCRKKWLTYLNWKESGGKDWVKFDEVDLINRIVKLNIQEESKIDWNKVANGWGSVRSPQWLREKWWKIKKTLPNYQTIKFTDLLDQLQNVYIPQLIEKLEKDINTSLIDSKDPQEKPSLPVDSLPEEMTNFTDCFDRTLPLTQYELQLLMNSESNMNGELNQQVLNLMSGDVDLINGQLQDNSIEIQIAKSIDTVDIDSLKAGTSLTLSNENSLDFQTSIDKVNSIDFQSILCKANAIDFQSALAKLKAEFGNGLKSVNSISRDITFDCDDIKSLTDDALLGVNAFSESSNISTVSLSDVM